MAAQLPGLGAQGRGAPAAPRGHCPRPATPRAARDVFLPTRERPEAALGHRPFPRPRQRLGLSSHRVHAREGKPPHREQAAGACLTVASHPVARPGDRERLTTTHELGSRSNRCAQWANRLAHGHPVNNGTRLCFGSPGMAGSEG